MTRQQEMENDIEHWVEECGFDDVLDALICACNYWATQKDTPPIEVANEVWTRREHALRHAQWEAQHAR